LPGSDSLSDLRILPLGSLGGDVGLLHVVHADVS
jgi:hypothetical protein